ncbi:MAG: EamA family transporter, partial [Candidatus Marinimicrobia bacterium]|nr:EamA family transporter [Candidatus Neomarinimicrobiota bacterium]
LGVSLSLLAVQHTATGIASTIMAIVPVLIIPLAILIKKERTTLKEIVGAAIAVGGVSIYFIV